MSSYSKSVSLCDPVKLGSERIWDQILSSAPLAEATDESGPHSQSVTDFALQM